MVFNTTYRVRFGQVDLAQVVYYPRIFDICHQVMESFFDQALRLPYAEVLSVDRVGFPVVRTAAQFEQPLRYGDELDIALSITDISRKSVTFSYELRRGSQPLAQVEVVTVAVNMDTFAAIPLPPVYRERMLPFVAAKTAARHPQADDRPPGGAT